MSEKAKKVTEEVTKVIGCADFCGIPDHQLEREWHKYLKESSASTILRHQILLEIDKRKQDVANTDDPNKIRDLRQQIVGLNLAKAILTREKLEYP